MENITRKFIRRSSAAGILLFLGAMVPVYAQNDEKGNKQGGGKQEHAQQPPQRQERPQAPPQRAQQPPQQRPQQQPQQQEKTQPQRADQPQRPQREQVPQRAQQPQPVPQQQRVQRPQERQPQERARQGAPPQTERTQQEARSWQQQRGWLRNGGWQGHNDWQQDRAQHWASDHRTWAQRGGYGGYYIPRDRFNIYFGRQHVFRLHTTPVFYLGYPRFEYGGFSFLLLDPWPEYWPVNWYDSDDLYIDYDDYDGGYYLYNRRDPQVRLAVTVVL
jgi:hypothetical protein